MRGLVDCAGNVTLGNLQGDLVRVLRDGRLQAVFCVVDLAADLACGLGNGGIQGALRGMDFAAVLAWSARLSAIFSFMQSYPI